MEIEKLTSSELASELKARGVDVGPIVASTRKVYERKLQRLLNEEDSGEGVAAYHHMEEEYAEEEFDQNSDTQPIEEVMEPTYSQRRASPVRPQPTTDFPRQVPRSSPQRPAARQERGDASESRHYESSETILTRRSLRPTATTVTGRGPVRPQENTGQSKSPAKRGMPVWVQVLIFLAVAVLIFLVIQNMEPAAKDPLEID